MSENSTAVATKIDWTSLAGITLDGGCEVKDALEVREDAARLRVRILGSGGRMGTAYFLQLEPKEADDQLDVWETLREVPHPNLNRPLSVGRRQVSGVDTVYLVLADADEKLAVVVPERPLEWEEAAEVLHSLEKALAHLHAYGLIHGSVSPETVQAVGYTIQLDTESVRRLGKTARHEWNKPSYLAPESGTANTTTAADVWCLGATLFEVLAQERYGTPGAELEEGLPLGGIISRCLEKNPATRCTLKEAPAIEKTPPAKPEPVKAPASVVVPAEAAKAPVHVEPHVKPHVEPEAAIPAPRTVPAGVKPENKAAESTPVTADRPIAPPRPVDNRIPGMGAPGARNPAAARMPQPLTPHPLTPKPVARQVAKEDMALVPVGKRHKKVQGKRQGVDARIRTLDGPSREVPDDIAASMGPAARILAIGKRANFVRGIIAGVLLAALFIAAVWFIIIPKLQSPLEPVVNGESAQAAPPAILDGTIGDGAIGDKAIGAAAAAGPPSPASLPNVSAPGTPPAGNVAGKSMDAASSEESNQPFIRKRPELFHVVLTSTETRADAMQRLDKLSQQHPELFLQVMPTRSAAGARVYFIIAGGVLSRNEADQLRQRIMSKGLQTAQIVPYHP
jgi:hypothetical protein